jgi:hypothetical protein
MTPLQIITLLKATRDNSDPAVLWVNHARREAAVHPGNGETYCLPVAYSDAMIARTDPALDIISATDGETLAA